MQASLSFIQHMVILELFGSVLGLAEASGRQERTITHNGQLQEKVMVVVVVVVIYLKTGLQSSFKMYQIRVCIENGSF